MLVKDPDATLDYSIDWSSGYLESGETLLSSAWIVSPTEVGGLEVVDGSAQFSGGAATVFVRGGVLGHTYDLTNRISSTSGRVDDRTITILVQNR